MGQLGLGVMLNMLAGGSEHGTAEFVGRTITSAEIVEAEDSWRGTNGLRLGFSDGEIIEIYDNGQSCCEHRYMRTDDDVKSLIGHQLRDLLIKEAPNEPDQYGEHEVRFLEVQTTGGFITIANHNEHNGYYGGFSLAIRKIEPRR